MLDWFPCCQLVPVVPLGRREAVVHQPLHRLGQKAAAAADVVHHNSADVVAQATAVAGSAAHIAPAVDDTAAGADDIG